METNDLYKFVLILTLVGMIIGVGVLTMDKFGIAAKDSTNLNGESIAIAAGIGSTTNDDVTGIRAFYNGTSVLIDGNESVSAALNFTAPGVISVNADLIGAPAGTYSINYTYDADSKATTALFSTRDEVSNVSTVWLGLIVTIAILSIILGLVISSFARSFGR